MIINKKLYIHTYPEKTINMMSMNIWVNFIDLSMGLYYHETFSKMCAKICGGIKHDYSKFIYPAID